MICVLLTAQTAYGAGFSVNTQGATALGQANSVIAHTDDPSSVFFNPALINKLPGTQVEIGTALIFPTTTFQSNIPGNDSETQRAVYLPSNLFVTHKFNDKMSAGLGVFSNFGLSTVWPDNWEGRYIATNTKLQTVTVNPVVSYQVTPRIALAGGIDIIYVNADLNKMILTAPGVPDIPEKLTGDDTGAGVNLGLLIDITDDLALGASYRSKLNTDIRGNISFGLAPGTPQAIAALFPNTSAQAYLHFPPMANFGIAYKGFKPLTLEIGGRWEGWSSFQSLSIQTAQPVAGMNEIVTPKNWRDIYSVNIGARYQITDALAFLSGYLHETNPIPDSTFDPSVPDNSSNVYTVGTDLKYKNFLFSLAYDYQKVSDRTKDNAIDDNPSDGIVNPNTSANGQYRTHLNIIAASITCKF
jgi:long-chain fatty acid transport protein